MKLVRGASHDEEWLFDLNADPLELAAIRDAQAISALARERLPALRAEVNHPRVQAKAEVTAPPPEVSADEVEDIERKMRLMGYM